MTILVQKLREDATLPTRGSLMAAGLDLYAVEPMRISRVGMPPPKAIPTGISIALPYGTVGLIWPRSSLAAKYDMRIRAGVIDEDYRGEIQVLATVSHPMDIIPGMRIAQLVVQPVRPDEVQQMDELPGTERGDGGFGSTGE